MKNRNTKPQTPKKKKHKQKREIEGITVFGNTAFFQMYLLDEIGGRWPRIKDSLYDAGYTPTQVNTYRDGLLHDFFAFCKKHHLDARV